ncbi:hypothetical protein RIR_jg16810.t1 [Rhizophagus irregularis DAOM 181602=DAOM 197198]|nr:hypothetical protein RIR_jg16810.t1 [Rhizophagus irregularis DAOM 181602=DAOM 197198]CAB4496236.1 unnamed protein product [Rhizophagus irregularis]
MSTTATRTQQKSKNSYHTSQPPTESMIEAAKIDYATRLFLHTQQQLQQVYSSPSEDKERKNNKGFMRKDYANIGNILPIDTEFWNFEPTHDLEGVNKIHKFKRTTLKLLRKGDCGMMKLKTTLETITLLIIL